MSLFLACLLVGAILACSCVALRTWRRGKRMPQLLCAKCLRPHDPAQCMTDEDREFIEKLRAAIAELERLRCGSSSPCASTAARPTAATTATSTTPATGGSPGPGSATGEQQTTISHQRPEWSDVMCTGIPEEDGITPCGLTGGHDEHPKRDRPRARLQHNPHSVRIDASSRKQFGMCDYPD